MNAWIDSAGKIVERPKSEFTAAGGVIPDDVLAKEHPELRCVETPLVDKKYWLPFDGTKISAMTKDQQDAVDAASAKAVEDSAKAAKEDIDKAESARLADRERITKMEPAKAIGELFDMIRPSRTAGLNTEPRGGEEA